MKRSKTNKFLIEGTPLLVPDEGVSIKYIDDFDFARDESGYPHKVIIRKGVKTWRFSYSILTAEEYKYICALIRGREVFTFSYQDENGEMQNTAAFCNETNAVYWSGRRGLYKNLEFEISE